MEDIDIHDYLLDFMLLARVRPIDEQVVLERSTILKKEEEQEINYCGSLI